jgi:hypothetical protein
MNNLLKTVQDSIANCVEVSYNEMQLAEAITMMKIDSTADLQEYVLEKTEE